MSFRKKAKKHKEDLQSRHEEAIESKDETGSGEYGTIFLKDEVPEGIEFWRPEYGEHLIDIIPFFSGKNNPRVEAGRMAYVIDVWVHRSTNPPFVCQVKNFKLNDPICEYIRKNRLPTPEWKKVAPKRRTVYLVWVHDTLEEEAKGLQVWEVAHFFFEKNVDAIAKNPKGGAPVIFSDPDKGKSIAFEITKSGTYKDEQGTDRDSQDWLGHRFIDRDESIPDEILDQSFPLDDIIDMHPDEEKMSAAFYGEEKEEAEQEEELEEAKTEEELEEEDEAEAEEEEETEKDEQDCPAGATFGVDCDEYENCDSCDIYDDCSDLQEQLKKEAEAKKSKKKVVVKKKVVLKKR